MSDLGVNLHEVIISKPLKACMDDIYKWAMPIWDAFEEEHGLEPTQKDLANLIIKTHNLRWKYGSIVKEFTSHKLKAFRQEYLASKEQNNTLGN